jgi:hypothetical protein
VRRAQVIADHGKCIADRAVVSTTTARAAVSSAPSVSRVASASVVSVGLMGLAAVVLAIVML